MLDIKKINSFHLISWLLMKARLPKNLKEFLLSSGFHLVGKENNKYIYVYICVLCNIYFLNTGCLYMFQLDFLKPFFKRQCGK